MKKCVTVWNYPGNRVKNAYRFHSLGFDAISWLGSEFACLTSEEDEQIVDMLKQTGMQFTVHSRLPDPEKAESCEKFIEELKRVVAWQEKYGLLHSYTFDFWFDVPKTLPYLKKTIDAFRNKSTIIACEDIPLTKRQLDGLRSAVSPKDNFGILLDLGHMNMRQRCIELIEPEDFIASIEALPLPIIEVHVHDNMSYKDEHMYLGYGTLPIDAVIEGLKRKNFNGTVTIEIVRRDWDEEQTFQYAVDSCNLFFNRWNEIKH